MGLAFSVSSSRRSRRSTVGTPGSPAGTAGNMPITSDATSRHYDYNSTKAPFSVVTTTIPTGHSTNFSNLYYFWKWTDAGGAQVAYGPTACLDIKSDGSSSYVVDVDLHVIDRLTGNRIDENGTTVTGRSGRVTLTVTNNSSAAVWDVVKSGSAITATRRVVGTVLTANEAGGATYANLRDLINANKASNQVWSVGAGTYSWPSTVDFTGLTNIEFSAANGQSSSTVILSLGAATFAPFTEGASASTQRYCGFTISGTGYSAGGSLFNPSVSPTLMVYRDIKCTSGKQYGFIEGDGTLTSMFYLGLDLTIGQYFLIQGGRQEHIHFVGNRGRQISSGEGSPDQSKIRMNNSRYLSFVNNDFDFTGVFTNPLIRNVGALSWGTTYWNDGAGHPQVQWHYYRGNRWINTSGSTNHTCIRYASDPGGSDGGNNSRVAYIQCDNDIFVNPNGTPGNGTIQRWYQHGGPGEAVGSTIDLTIRNPQQGTSLGSLSTSTTFLLQQGPSATRVSAVSQTEPAIP